MEQTREAMTALLQRQVEIALSDERRAIYASMRDQSTLLKDDIQRLGRAGQTLAESKAKLFETGNELTRVSGILMAEIRENGTAAQIGQAANVDSAVLLVRVSNWRFLATRDPQGPATFGTTAFGRTPPSRLCGTSIRPVVHPPDQGAPGHDGAYVEAFNTAAGALAATRTAYDDNLKPHRRPWSRPAQRFGPRSRPLSARSPPPPLRA